MIKFKLSYLVTPLLLVYAYDVYHVYRVYKEDRSYSEGVKPTDEEIEDLKKVYNVSDNEKTTSSTVTTEEYNEELDHFENTRSGRAKSYLIQRESIIFSMGGRAAFLQTAHPYVSTAIVEHSSLKKSIQRRFVLTMQHMFSMAFGDNAEALKSARLVRSLHENVSGEIKADIGYFKKGHKYEANHLHALLWVLYTLMESSIFAFELYVRKLTPEEIDQFYSNYQTIGLAFGIPKHIYPEKYNELKHQMTVFCKSDFLGANQEAMELKHLLFYHNHKDSSKRLLGKIVEWTTFMTMPIHITKKFFNREPSRTDVFCFSLLGGYVRFTYRLMPRKLRYLNDYLDHLGQNKGILPYVSAQLVDRFFLKTL